MSCFFALSLCLFSPITLFLFLFHTSMPVRTRFVIIVFLYWCNVGFYCVCRLLERTAQCVRIYVCIHTSVNPCVWIVGARSFLRVNVYAFIVLLLAYFNLLLLLVWLFGVCRCLCVWFFSPTKIQRRRNRWRLSKMNIQQLDHGGSTSGGGGDGGIGGGSRGSAVDNGNGDSSVNDDDDDEPMRRACGMGKPNSNSKTAKFVWVCFKMLNLLWVDLLHSNVRGLWFLSTLWIFWREKKRPVRGQIYAQWIRRFLSFQSIRMW